MDDQSSDSTLEPAQQWNCTLQSVKSNQINHVKSLRAMTKALTQKQNKTQIEIGCRLFLLVRFAQNILIHQHQKKSQPVRQTDTRLDLPILVHPATDHYVHYY